MSHGITDIDKGFVNAVSTWHGLPQYVCLNRAVTMKEAASVLNFEIEKRQLTRLGNRGQAILVGAWSLVRPDHDFTLVDSVGERFQVLNNNHMMKIIDEFVLAAYPDLEIESVGTLWGGATVFINLKMGEFAIKGDSSKSVTNLMYANPLGKGSYLACAHSTRIVCNNTLRMAEAQGAANKTLAKFRHTATAGARIKDHFIDLAEVKLGMKSFVKQMEELAKQGVNSEYLDNFLNEFFPMPEEAGRGRTMAENNRDSLAGIFEGGQHMVKAVSQSKYGLLNAYTDFIDHETISRNSDAAAIRWDGVNGIRAASKDEVLSWLTSN